MKHRRSFRRPHLRAGVLALALGSAVGACNSVPTGAPQTAPRPASGASESAPTARCNPKVPESMLGRLVVTFTGASGGEVVVRLESDEYKSTVRVAATEGSTFEVPAATYRLRATLGGYRAIERTAAVRCGVDTKLELALSKR